MNHEEKVRKKVENDADYLAFYQSIIGLSSGDLKKNVLLYQKYLQETLVAMKVNSEIVRVEALKRKFEKPFRDAIKSAKDKIKQLKNFVDESICVEDLEQQIIKFTLICEEEKMKMSVDVDVLDAKEELKLLKGPFTDAKTVLETKISYLYFLIKEKGGDYSDD